MSNKYFTGLIHLLCLSGASLFFSCQKESAEECNLNASSIAGTYRLKSITYKMTSSSPEQDYLLLLDACERDDVFVMNANGTYQRNDAGISCIPDGSSIGTWSIQGNAFISDGVISGLIERFDCKSLVVYSTDNDVPGDKITIVIEKQ